MSVGMVRTFRSNDELISYLSQSGVIRSASIEAGIPRHEI